MPSTMIKLAKIREIKIFRCFTIVKAGLWCLEEIVGPAISVFLLGGAPRRWFQGRYPMQSTVFLLSGGDWYQSLGSLRWPEFRRQNYQRGEGLAEKVLQKSAWGPLKSSVAV